MRWEGARLVLTLDPNLLDLGGFVLSWHGVLVLLAVVLGVWLGVRLGSRWAGVARGPLWDLAFWAVIGGFVGARLFHLLDHLPYYLAYPLEALRFWKGGIAVYGGFVGGVVGGLLYARRRGLPVWPLLDAGAFAMLAGQFIGRIGCLINGDAWGRPTGGTWGLIYAHPDALLPAEYIRDRVPTHPYPLYEMASVALLALALVLARRRGWLRRPGDAFLWAGLGYALLRFGLTFLREGTVVVLGLQEAQVVALLTGAACAWLLWRRGRPALRPAPVREGQG